MSDPILNPDTETADLRVADPVRKLTEDIADALVEAVRDALEGAGGDVHAVPIIESRLRAFLAEQESKQAGALAALRGALEEIRDFETNLGHASTTNMHYMAVRALAPGAGKAEAEVIRAAVAEREAERWVEKDHISSEEIDELSRRMEARKTAVDAMLAARGGKG